MNLRPSAAHLAVVLSALALAVTWTTMDSNLAPVSAAGSSGGLYSPVTPFRAIDTRPGLTAARTTLTVDTRAPAGAVAAAVNITIDSNQAPGYLVAWSGGGVRPETSIINAAASDTIANFAIVPVAPDGTIGIWPLMTTGIIVDVMGYVIGDATSALNGLITAQVTGYSGQSGSFAYTTVIGTVTNGTAVEQDLRLDVPCGNGLTGTDNVYSIQPGETLGWSVFCNDVFFTSGATVTIVRV